MLEMFLRAGSLGMVLLRRRNTCSRRPLSNDMTLGVISRTCPSYKSQMVSSGFVLNSDVVGEGERGGELERRLQFGEEPRKT